MPPFCSRTASSTSESLSTARLTWLLHRVGVTRFRTPVSQSTVVVSWPRPTSNPLWVLSKRTWAGGFNLRRGE
ncbi:hypothetical protein ACS0TY_012262 [Phlomoides rotata]